MYIALGNICIGGCATTRWYIPRVLAKGRLSVRDSIFNGQNKNEKWKQKECAKSNWLEPTNCRGKRVKKNFFCRGIVNSFSLL